MHEGEMYDPSEATPCQIECFLLVVCVCFTIKFKEVAPSAFGWKSKLSLWK